jgi:hypothetical protein
MNQYLFYTIKALDNHLNQDLIRVIWNQIKNHAGLIIQDRLLTLYLKRVSINCIIYLHLCSITPNSNNSSLYVEKFIFHMKNNICYSYIQDYRLWTERIMQLINNYELREKYVSLLTDIYQCIVFSSLSS